MNMLKDRIAALQMTHKIARQTADREKTREIDRWFSNDAMPELTRMAREGLPVVFVKTKYSLVDVREYLKNEDLLGYLAVSYTSEDETHGITFRFLSL